MVGRRYLILSSLAVATLEHSVHLHAWYTPALCNTHLPGGEPLIWFHQEHLAISRRDLYMAVTSI
jgi:hypothetical protein